MQNHSAHPHTQTHHTVHSTKHSHEKSHPEQHEDQMPDEHSTREFALKKLKEIMSIGITDKDILHQASNVATQIEQHLYTTNHGANNQYKHKFRSISFNLQHNSKLRDQLLRVLITPEQLCNMTTFDMAPESLKNEREKIEKEHIEGTIEDKDAYETMRYTVGQWIDKNEQLEIDQ